MINQNKITGKSGEKNGGKTVSGTCEKIGFTDFSTTHFQ
jgi:hypothetical protein